MPSVKFAQSSQFRFRSAFFFAFPLLLGVMFPQVLSAQAPSEKRWKEYSVDDKLNNNENKALVYKILKDGDFAGNQAKFEEFYKKYMLPRWTLLKNWGQLAAFRTSLRNDFRLAKTGPVHQFLTKMVLAELKRMVEDEQVHPFARSNAMLALGEMNVEDSITGGGNKPFPDVLPYLLTAAEDTKQQEGLRVAAMVGLSRHVASKIPDADKLKVQAMLLKLLAADSNSPPKTPLREWLQCQAVEMLGQIGMLGPDNQAVQVLTTVAGNTKTPFWIRDIAVRSLGQLNYPSGGAPGLNAAAIGSVVVQALADACDAELKKTQEEELLRRLLKTRLDAATQGIRGSPSVPNQPGIKSLAGDQAAKARFDGLEKSFKSMQKDLDDKNLTGSKLKGKIREYRQKFKDWAANKPDEKEEKKPA
jgi:hypothetical protein